MIRLHVLDGVPVAQAFPRVAVSWLRRAPELSRLVGTSRGFEAGAADLHRWMLFTTSDRTPRLPASQTAVLTLDPLSSRGSWGGWSPTVTRRSWDGPVVAITRARLRLSHERRFRRAVPPVAAQLSGTGVRWWAGFGELPVGFQGTVSVWPSAAALTAFAHRGEHRAVVERTPHERWYAEELFVRCALVAADGVLDSQPAADLLG